MDIAYQFTFTLDSRFTFALLVNYSKDKYLIDYSGNNLILVNSDFESNETFINDFNALSQNFKIDSDYKEFFYFDYLYQGVYPKKGVLFNTKDYFQYVGYSYGRSYSFSLIGKLGVGKLVYPVDDEGRPTSGYYYKNKVVYFYKRDGSTHLIYSHVFKCEYGYVLSVPVKVLDYTYEVDGETVNNFRYLFKYYVIKRINAPSKCCLFDLFNKTNPNNI